MSYLNKITLLFIFTFSCAFSSPSIAGRDSEENPHNKCAIALFGMLVGAPGTFAFAGTAVYLDIKKAKAETLVNETKSLQKAKRDLLIVSVMIPVPMIVGALSALFVFAVKNANTVHNI